MNPRNQATMVVRNGPLLGPVLTRVIGMLAARAQCPIDRLDDALLVADTVAAHSPDHAINGQPRSLLERPHCCLRPRAKRAINGELREFGPRRRRDPGVELLLQFANR